MTIVVQSGVLRSVGGLGLRTGLSAFWEFANTSWTDSTGNGSTLSVAAGAPTVGSGPGSNSSIVLNGTTEYLTCANNSNLTVGGVDFSINVWRLFLGTNARNILMKAGASAEFTVGHYYGFGGFATGHIFTHVGAADNVLGDGTVVGTDSAWHMVTLTFNASTAIGNLYFDTVKDANSPVGPLTDPPVTATTDPLLVGYDPYAVTYWNGSIALAGIWKNRVLSAGDMTLLYNSGAGRSYAAMA